MESTLPEKPSIQKGEYVISARAIQDFFPGGLLPTGSDEDAQPETD